MIPLPRRVTLVLCTGGGEPLGALPPFDVPVPWWQEAAPLVTGAREQHGVDVIVLRLLQVGAQTSDGHREIAYLAEVTSEPSYAALGPVDPTLTAALADDPLRLAYARPGGPAADLAWASDALAGRGTPLSGPPVQMRTWNLSSVWRLPISTGTTWLKVVPPFFAHEGRMIEALDGPSVPALVATDGPRVLLDEVPGNDQYDAPLALLEQMVPLLVGLQRDWVGRLPELQAMGLPDWRPDPLLAAAALVLDRWRAELDAATVGTLDGLLAGWADRFAAIGAAGVPDTLVHGDFHPGNVVGTPDRLVLLDWGDCGIGHPMLDQAAFLDRVPPAGVDALRATWSAGWRAAAPGCDPDRAAALLGPVAALRQAVIYQVFLDGIEPSERIYHQDDPVDWLRRAAALSG